MLRKILFASCLLATSMATQASLISHYGYERDSSSNIVKGGGLEWLKWDVTKGMSINSALSSYASQGWRLASNIEIASLFNSFEFGKTDWHDRESETQTQYQPWDSGEGYSSHIKFNHLFGATEQMSCSIDGRTSHCSSNDDPHIGSAAIFGADANKNGLYNLSVVMEDRTVIYDNGRFLRVEHQASMFTEVEWMTSFDAYSTAGVALVRDKSPVNVAVPTPGSIGLLALGLVALGLRRRKA